MAAALQTSQAGAPVLSRNGQLTANIKGYMVCCLLHDESDYSQDGANVKR
jgi:hypothetical protein